MRTAQELTWVEVLRGRKFVGGHIEIEPEESQETFRGLISGIGDTGVCIEFFLAWLAREKPTGRWEKSDNPVIIFAVKSDVVPEYCGAGKVQFQMRYNGELALFTLFPNNDSSLNEFLQILERDTTQSGIA